MARIEISELCSPGFDLCDLTFEEMLGVAGGGDIIITIGDVGNVSVKKAKNVRVKNVIKIKIGD